MSTRFFTNHGEQKLLSKFQGVFENNTDIEWFDGLVGYLRASVYFATCDEIDLMSKTAPPRMPMGPPASFVDSAKEPQGPRYTSSTRLVKATNLEEAF